jgi:hypothetical protein
MIKLEIMDMSLLNGEGTYVFLTPLVILLPGQIPNQV